MQVNGITSIKFYTPVFRAKSPLAVKPDRFEKSEALNYYEKLKTDMGILSGDDVKQMAQNIKSRVKDVSLEDVYYTMGVLSQFSGYKCWDELNKEMDKRNIFYTAPFNADNKINLACVMTYLMRKNSQGVINNPKNIETAYLLDANALKCLDTETIDNRGFYIYIKNFEKGYNFLNQSESFEDFTVRILRKIKNGNLKENLDKYLNGEIMEQINKSGINVNVMDFPVKVSPNEIAQNLNPVIISYDDFSRIINSNITGKEFALNFMKRMNVFVTPKELSENIKQMHHKIKEITKNSDNVYYTIPDLYKSFGLINYMYQKINNIPDEKFIYYNNPTEIKNLPKGSYVVVLDDASLTGLSMISERFNYQNLYLCKDAPDIRIILAPIYITGHAKQLISGILRKEDYLIYNKELPCCDIRALRKLEQPAIMSYIKENFLTSFVLPYMGPDTNCYDYRELYEKMLYSPDAQQEL